MTDMRKFRNFTIILSYCLAIGSQIFQLCNAVTLEEEFSIEQDSGPQPLLPSDADLLNVALNLEYLEAEFFLFSAYGKGLDELYPTLSGGGPPPIGGKKALLSSEIQGLVEMLGLEEVGHIKAIREYLGTSAIPRPQIDISVPTWSALVSAALGRNVTVDPYVGDLNWILSAFALPYVGLTGYVGASSLLQSPTAKRLVAGLLGVESGQDALLRTFIYSYKQLVLLPLIIKPKVIDVADGIAQLRSKLDKSVVDKDPKLIILPNEGAQNKTSINVLAGNQYSLSFPRSPREIFRVVYSSGDASKPGGFYPKGANGRFADFYKANPSIG